MTTKETNQQLASSANPSPLKEKVFSDIIEDFALATDFGSVLVDIRGNENSAMYNFSTFCKLMRSNPQFHSLCRKCDMYGGLEASKTGQPSIYRCHAGLTDISLPIIKDNQLSGFILFGQVETSDVDDSYFSHIQPELTDWQSIPELRKARDTIKVVSQNQIQSAASVLEVINQHYVDDDPRKNIQFTIKDNNTDKHVSNHEEIKKAVTYIQNHLTQPITLEEVSDHVYLSQYYFSKLFKKEMGVNFVTYLNQQRVEQAKALLVESSLSIGAISKSLGFSQTSYFCKIFKSLAGSTPAKFRKEHGRYT